jgi:excisionase family DNA binding protein
MMAAIPSERLSSQSAGREGLGLQGDEALDPEGRRQRLVPVRAAAEYLGVSPATVERLVSRGHLPIVKVGATARYAVEDLDDFIATNRFRERQRSA